MTSPRRRRRWRTPNRAPARGFRATLDDGFVILGFLAQHNGQMYAIYLDCEADAVDANLAALKAVASSFSFR